MRCFNNTYNILVTLFGGTIVHTNTKSSPETNIILILLSKLAHSDPYPADSRTPVNFPRPPHCFRLHLLGTSDGMSL